MQVVRFQALDLEEASLGTAASLGKYFDNATYGKIAGEKSPQPPPSSHKRTARLRKLKGPSPARTQWYIDKPFTTLRSNDI